MNNERLAAERRESWIGPPKFWRPLPESGLQQGVRSLGIKVNALMTGNAQPVSTIRTVHLDPSITADSAEYSAVELAVQASGARIVGKHSNAIQDILVIETPIDAIAKVSDIDGVQGVAPEGRARPAVIQARSSGGDALVFSGSDSCTATEAARGATKLDTLPFETDLILNYGAGTLVIVWDFAPELDSSQWGAELVDRPGGKAVQYNVTSTTKLGWHGSSVMSVCCGVSAGPAKGAKLAMVALGSTISSDLTVIRNLLDKWNGPAVVNMSFAVQFKVVTAEDRTATLAEFNRFDNFVRAMQAKNPRLVFVVAAGNESRDVCNVADLPDGEGGRMMQWPQQRFGATISPYVFIGATVAGVRAGSVTHTLATYSNYGRCIDALAPGGWSCAYQALLPSANEAPFQVVQGTSFAAPAASGLLALVFAARPGADGKEATQALLTSSRTVTGVPVGTSSKLVALPMDAAPPPVGGDATTGPSESLPEPSVLAPEENLPPPPTPPLRSSDLLPFVPPIAVALVLIVALAAFTNITAFLVAAFVAVIAVVVVSRLLDMPVNGQSSSPPLTGIPRPAQ